MSSGQYTFYATLETRSGELLSEERLDVDWHPALEWARFDACVRRTGQSRPPAAGSGPGHGATIRPVWSAAFSPPYVRGFAICEPAHDGECVEFPLTYFAGAVTKASQRLVEAGTLKAGQRFDYRVYALPDVSDRDAIGPSCEIVADDTFPAIHTEDAASLLRGAQKYSPLQTSNGASAQSTSADSTPLILIPRQVLAEATALAREADDVETGGVLVGRICRDVGGRICYRITALIPALHTQATRDSLRFTPETWVSVDAAIRLRNLGETAMGWIHSHPWFCRHCPPERRSLCAFSRPLFSQADRALHREVFLKPWNVAVLLSFLGEQEPSYDVFAWNGGQIEAAEFYVLPDDS